MTIDQMLKLTTQIVEYKNIDLHDLVIIKGAFEANDLEQVILNLLRTFQNVLVAFGVIKYIPEYGDPGVVKPIPVCI